MTDTRFSKAEQLFLEASELDAGERAMFLDRACGDDRALRDEVEAMLTAEGSSADYFDRFAGRLGIERLREDSAGQEADRTGQQFGSYRLTSLLGKGGMGSVWHAERDDGRFEGAVAVKLLTRSHSHAALERFDREAHYLARLTHPHIARLVDAGIGPGNTPFLILDYVEGVPIDAYCDSHRLGIDARLRLCIDVVDAVSHAHARLIVHNDIKPSNVLVTPDGTVKLLDFGIATLLSEHDEGEGVALTPEFASPEQLSGQRITTATDVYSLGLLLYMLLTGTSPRDVENITSLDELRNAVSQGPPSLASTLLRTDSVQDSALDRLAGARRASPRRLLKVLQGELDDIVQKALAVDVADRYENAADLAADLRRYLRGEPISALPDTFGYRSRKFVGRHRGSVLSAALMALLLIGAAIITTWQSIEARQQRDAAIYQQQRVHASNELYSLMLEEMGSGGASFTAVELLDRGAELLERQFDASDPFVGRVYYDLSRRYSNLREQNRELELLRQAEAAARSGGDDDLLAAALCSTAIGIRMSDPDRARANLVEGEDALSRVSEPSLDTVVACARLQAHLVEIDGDRDAAIQVLQRAVRHLEQAPAAPVHLRGITMNDLANLYYREARFPETLALLEQIVGMLERSGRGGTLGYTQIASNRASVLGSLGEVRAEAEMRRQLIERVEGSDWADERGMLPYRVTYAATLIRLSHYEEGISLAEDVLETADALGHDLTAAMTHLILAGGYAATDRPDDTERHVNAAEAALENNPGAWNFQLNRVRLLRAKIARQRGEVDAADAVVAELLAEQGYPSLAGGSPALMAALSAAASAALDAEDWPAAEQLATDLLALEQGVGRGPDTNADVGHALVQRARARTGLGRTDAARTDLERAIVVLTNGLGEDNAETTEARELLSALAP